MNLILKYEKRRSRNGTKTSGGFEEFITASGTKNSKDEEKNFNQETEEGLSQKLAFVRKTLPSSGGDEPIPETTSRLKSGKKN